MTLNPHPNHPSTGCYVLKLHRDAQPPRGRLSGRLEHITSGDWVDFETGEALLAWLLAHAAQTPPGAAHPAAPDGR